MSRSRLLPYATAVASVIGATILTYAIHDWIAPSVSLLFFPAVVIPAMYGGYGAASVATVLSTVVLAYVFIPPRYSFDIGVDDAIRLAVFVLVSFATAWLSSARRRAEHSERQSARDLRSAVDTLRKVSGWPVVVGPDAAANVRRMLTHAAGVVKCGAVVAVWETEDEPWLYVAGLPGVDAVVTRHSPSFADDWNGGAFPPALAKRLPAGAVASGRFRTEHLTGRVFFASLEASETDVAAILDVVAREIGNSLDQVYVSEQARELAVREDRIRVSRDLHDGVLQAITGIRLELQSLADEAAGPGEVQNRLLAIERALAIEQRELRLIIDDMKPRAPGVAGKGLLAGRLDEMRLRMEGDWKTPIAVAVSPPDIALDDATMQEVRLMIHEAVVNALKHAHPSRVSVDVRADEASLYLTVSDDGRGFPFQGRVEHEKLMDTSAGPASLRDRAAALNGRVTIESSLVGSRVAIKIPLPTA